MKHPLSACCVAPDSDLLGAMRVIDRIGQGIAMVTDKDGRLLGILTDGDMRRALLGGAPLQARVADHMQTNYISVSPATSRNEVIDLMQARVRRQIPVVEESGKLVGLHLLHELIGWAERPNWAVVMAGGRGARLQPITERMPKPMVRVAGRPILERIILHLVSYGIHRVFLSINYLGHIIEDHFGNGNRFGCQIEYLRETTSLGTGGALSLLPEQADHPVLVLNGDLLIQTDVSQMLEFHGAGGFYATMGLRPYTHEVAYGCVEVNGDRLTALEEKPVLTRLINAGMYVLSPRAIRDVPVGTHFPITNLFEAALEAGKPCGAYIMEEDWLDVGSPHHLREAHGM